MRLIDADGLIKKAYRSEMWNRSTQAFDLFVVDAEDVEDAPTVDAEPVRHGRWTDDGVCIDCGFDALYWANTSIQVRSHYCPNCGAKMDAEVQDGTE